MKDNIMVLAFPINDFDREKLDNMTDAELLALAEEYKSVLRWERLSLFQDALNDDSVNTGFRWIYFVAK